MAYHLYPPFFVVPEESDFADAWEAFCCKLLNLTLDTDEVYRRHPPEQGVDLYYPARQIAYQCKSVESGKSGDFKVRSAIESITSAKAVSESLPWTEYALCTNVDITGTAEAKLRLELPKIVIRPRSYWIKLCEEFRESVERNFRLLLTVPEARVVGTINDAFETNYSEQLKSMLDTSRFNIFLYSNRNDRVYRVPVAPDFKVDDLVHILRWFFQLPGPRTIQSEGISVSLSHAIVFDGNRQVFSKTLRETGIKDGSVVTYSTTLVWEEESAQFSGDLLHMITRDTFDSHDPRKRAERAMKLYEGDIHKAFVGFDKGLTAMSTKKHRR
ncbi:MAG: hypothetical protein AABN34_08060 [Acidobacteriota bacterium]